MYGKSNCTSRPKKAQAKQDRLMEVDSEEGEALPNGESGTSTLRYHRLLSRGNTDRSEDIISDGRGITDLISDDALQILARSLENISKVSTRYLRLVERDRGVVFDPTLGDYVRTIGNQSSGFGGRR